MLRAGLWAMLFAALWSMAAAPAAATDAKAPPSLESYGALPALDHMNLSPGGKFVSYLLASGDDRRVIIRRYEGGAPVADVAA